MRKGIVILVAGLFLAGNVMAERALDYAAEDAGYEITKALSNRQLSVGKIAFLGLFGDRANLTAVMEAEITRHPGVYEFYTRKEKDWDILTSEIEFGERKSDIMDEATIQKFGRIKGVEALLYGDVREATVKDGKGSVRLTIKLADVKTGQILWSANIEGRYEGELKSPGKLIAKAVADAAGKAARSLALQKSTLGKINIYLMPINTADVRLSDYVLPEFTRIGDARIRFFSNVAGQSGRRIVNKMATELSSSGIGAPDLKRISKQLDQLFGDSEATDNLQTRDAVLYGHFGEVSADENVASVMLNLHLADLVTGQELWGQTVEGRAIVAAQDAGYRILKTNWHYILIGIVVIVVLGMFVRSTRRPR